MNNVCPNCGFPNDNGITVCRKCKVPFTPTESVDDPELQEAAQSDASAKPQSGSYIVMSGAAPKSLDLDFSDEAPPGEDPTAVSSDLSKEVDLGKRIAQPLPEGGQRDSSIPSEPIIMEKDDLDFDPGAMLAGRSRLSSPEATISSVLPGIPIRDSMIESVEPASATFETNPAGFFRRALSALTDLVLTVLVAASASVMGVAAFGKDALMTEGLKDPGTFTGILGPQILPLFLIIFLVYEFFFHFLTGRTPGKRLAGTMVLTSGGEALSVGRAAARSLSTLLTMATLTVGFLWIIVDDRSQALHDKLAGTIVIRDKRKV